jgi:RNA polymerase sigma factor (sigma-70 family)
MLGSERLAVEEREAARSGGSEEADLLDRVAAGELRAFETLYRTYYPRLSRFVLNITHRQRLVEEVINDTMMVVWDKAAKYDGNSKVSTWVFGIAYRKALKALRKWDEPVSDRHIEARASAEPGPEHQVGDRQRREALRGAIRKLSPDHRAVVDLAYFHEFGYREIAEIMACPVDTVKTRMFHARRRLKSLLAGGLGDWL